MILLDMKNSKTTSSPLGLSASKDKPLLSFADLLKGAGDKKESKVVQNGSLVLAIDTQESSIKTSKNTVQKSQHLSTALKIEEKSLKIEEAEFLELNPKLTAALTSEEIRTLINDAKNYLKEKIQSSDGYKNAEIKELPKTLGSLIEVANKMGIDITKISLEEVKQPSLSGEQKSDLPQKNKLLETVQADKNLQKEIPQEKGLETLKDVLAEKKAMQPIQNGNPKEDVTLKQETVVPKQGMLTQKLETAPKQEYPSTQNNIPKDEKSSLAQISAKETPLFKAQAQSEHVATEQLVQAKANNLLKPEQKQTKEKNDEPLKLLLSDDGSSSNTLISQNISQSVAKEIQPASGAEGIKTLEQLLNGESSSGEPNQTTIKTEPFIAHKADSLDVKINEAKQMIRYLSDDIKSAIDDYKSPFTRVKVQLNPQHLGEVDLTVVQRGKNLHVNITSNNNAINTLAMNVNELRVQLNNSGINNATFHFNDNSQQSFSDSQNQSRQNEQRKAHEEYNYFENEEANEEILSSLEVVIPQYI